MGIFSVFWAICRHKGKQSASFTFHHLDFSNGITIRDWQFKRIERIN